MRPIKTVLSLVKQQEQLIVCLFLGAAESTGLNLAHTKISGAAQLNAGRAEPTRVSQSKKNKSQYDEVCAL